jgi:hypothetical protein
VARPLLGREADAEAAAVGARRERGRDLRERVRRGDRVGVEEPQDAAARRRRARVLLERPPARGVDHARSGGPRRRDRPVRRAAVGDDDLERRGIERGDGVEEPRQTGGLVPRRNDDRDPAAHASPFSGGSVR